MTAKVRAQASGRVMSISLFDRSMFRGRRFHRDVSTGASKYSPATLIQGIAVTFLHHAFQQAPYGFYPIHQMVEFHEFLPGQRSPSLRSLCDTAETEKQLPDFVQRKTELARALDDCQAIKSCRVVASLAAHSQGGGKKSDSLVVANRGGLKSNLPGYLRNRQLRHDGILRLRRFDYQIEPTKRFESSLCLKVNFRLHPISKAGGQQNKSQRLERKPKNTMRWILAVELLLACGHVASAQSSGTGRIVPMAQTAMAAKERADTGAIALDAQREKRALQVFLKAVETPIVSAADAMPAVKYGFAPTDGEFKGVRTFGQQVKHLAATNIFLAAAALGEEPASRPGGSCLCRQRSGASKYRVATR